MNTVQDSINGIAAVEDKLLREQRFLNAVNFESAVTPQVLTASVNDYNPPQLRKASVLRLSASTPVNITGLATGRNGRFLVIENVGTSAITLKNLSASGRSENQFNMGSDSVVAAAGAIILMYDSTLKSWIALGAPALGANSITEATLVSAMRPRENLLINGDFFFFQRMATPSSFNLPSAYAGYVADRWYLTGESGTNDIKAQQDTHAINTSNGSQFTIRFANTNAASKRIAINQIIESYQCDNLRGRTVTFQVNYPSGSSNAINYRVAIISMTGSRDSYTAAQKDCVNNWASTTYTTGNFFKATSTTVTYTVVGVSGSLTQNGIGNGGLGSVSGTVPSDCQNLLVMIWTDAQIATGTTNFLQMQQCLLVDGGSTVDFINRPRATELALCQRYFESSVYGSATPSDGGFAMPIPSALTVGDCATVFHTTKRVAPTMTFFDNLGASGKVSQPGVADGLVVSSSSTGTDAILSITRASNFTTGSPIKFGWLADAEL